MIRTIVRIVKNAVAKVFHVMRRVAVFAAGIVGGVLDAIFAGEIALPEPEVFAPTDEWVEETETLRQRHEIAEAEGRLASNPNSALYRYICIPRGARDTIDISSASPDAQAWARRLSDSECALARRAGCEAMLRHLAGKRTIAGVGAVRKSAPVLDFMQRATGEYDHATEPMLDMPFGYRSAM